MEDESIESIVEQLTYTKGVVGVFVCTADGVPIRDSFQNLDRSVAMAYVEMASECCRRASALFSTPIVRSPASLKAPAKDAGEGESPKKTDPAKEKPPTGGPIMESSLELLRIRTRLNEVIVQCHKEFLLVIVQESD
ncbi:unnamed protein product [Phytomonas sp. Hart1]|nr:unnamed protein product [Phytomonas sp. Hart1]|eukprot:CCW68433.1 unnamed protein product [Phytomonas sp. isolate Hart1]